MTSRKISMVSVLGSDMNVPGILASMSGALAEKNINVLAIYQSIRQVDIRVVVAEDHYELTIAALHKALIENQPLDAVA